MSRPDLRRSEAPFQVVSDYKPSGDQPKAIDELARRIEAGERDVVLLGAATVVTFLKLVPETAHLLPDLPRQELFPGSKPYALADELLDDPERLRELLLALERALPEPKPKRPRSGKSVSKR